MSGVFQAGHLPGLSMDDVSWHDLGTTHPDLAGVQVPRLTPEQVHTVTSLVRAQSRSEEHTSELQSH